MFKIRKPNLEVLIIFLFGLIPLLWFKEGYLAGGHDMSYPLAPIDFWLDRLFVWTDRIGSFGSNQTDAIPGIFNHGLQALLYVLAGSLQLAQKLDFIFWFTLPGITMYVLLRSLHPNKEDFVIRISGSLFYMLNHYLLQGWLIAEVTKFSIVAALPIIVLLIVNVMYRKRSVVKNSLLVGFTLFFLNGGAGIPLWGGLAVVCLASFVTLFVLNPKPFIYKFWRGLTFIFLSITFVAVLNLYWIYPYLKSFAQNYTARVEVSGGREGAVAWSKEISKYASLDNLIKLQGIPDWYDNPKHPYSNNFLNNPLLIFLSIIFPAIAFLGFLRRSQEDREKTIYKILFLVLLIVALPLTAGSHPPTGKVYDFLLINLPGFSIFRTPFYKFGMVLWFVYAYLSAVGLKNIIDLIGERLALKRKNFRFVGISVLCVFLGVLSIYNYPFFTGSFFNWSDEYSTMVKVPDYIFAVKEKMDNNKFSTRTLVLPELDWRTKQEVYDWRYLSLSTIPSILTRRPIVINDATLRGWEDVLISAIYTELRTKGDSRLLDYTGADRVVLREDFAVPDDMEYEPGSDRDILDNTNKFILTDRIGKWDFYNIKGSNVRPLIYSPNTIDSYVAAEPGNLLFAADIPGVDWFTDSFVFTDPVNPAEIGRSKNSLYVIQGLCSNCMGGEDKDIEVIKPEPSRILPGTNLYFLVQLIEKIKRKNIAEPSQQIDFDLGVMAKNAASLKILAPDRKKNKVVGSIIDSWYLSLGSIRSNYLSIQDEELKLRKSRDIYQYLWFFVLGSQEWKYLVGDRENAERMVHFESDVRKYIHELGLMSSPPIESVSNDTLVYKINIPREEVYKISVYYDSGKLVYPVRDKLVYPDFPEEVVGEGTSEQPANSVTFDGSLLDMEQDAQNNKWQQSQLLSLYEGEHVLVLPKPIQQTRLLGDLKLEAQAANSACKDVNLGNVDSKVVYKVEFNYRSISGRPVDARIIERNKANPEGQESTIGLSINELSKEDNLYSVEFTYAPERLVETAVLRYCIDGYYLSPTYADVERLTVKEFRPNPLVFASSVNHMVELSTSKSKIEFVSLNQTKYLVKVADAPKSFVLGFNSRFDDQWIVREVDPKTADKFFTGETKSYLGGRAIEYERKDKHVFTDYLFPRGAKAEYTPKFPTNAFGSAWVLDGNEGSVYRTYLLEYTHQNTLYRMGLISLVGFIFFSILYFLIKQKNRQE